MNKALSGEKKYRQLKDKIQDSYFKLTTAPRHIYFVYEETPGNDKLNVTREYYRWDDATSGYVIEDNKTVSECLNLSKGSAKSFSMGVIPDNYKKAFSQGYSLGNVSLNYTPSGSDTDTAIYLGCAGDTTAVPYGVLTENVDGIQDNSGVWDGDNNTKDGLKNAINSKMNGWKNFKNGEPLQINSQYLVSYTVRYFEPYAPYTTARYVRYKTKGKYKYAPIIERDTSTRVKNVGAPATNSAPRSSDKNNANYGNDNYSQTAPGARKMSYIVLCGKMNMPKYKNTSNGNLAAVKRLIAGFYASKYKVTVQIPNKGEKNVQLYGENEGATAFNNYRWAFSQEYLDACLISGSTSKDLTSAGKTYNGAAVNAVNEIVGKLQAGCAYEVNKRTAKLIALYYPECYVGGKVTDESNPDDFVVAGSNLIDGPDPINPPKLITSKIKGYKGSTGHGFAWKKGNLAKTPGTSNKGAIEISDVNGEGEGQRRTFNFDNSKAKGNVLVLTYRKEADNPGASLTVRYHLSVGASSPDKVTDWDSLNWMEIKNSTYLSDSGALTHDESVSTSVGVQVPGNYSSDATYYYVGAKFRSSGASTSFNQNETAFNSGYTGSAAAATMTSEVAAGGAGVVDLYYYGCVNAAVTSSPKPTTTTYEWDETGGGGGGSWSSPKPYDEGGSVGGGGKITANATDAKGEETADVKVTSDLELGADGEITLPNGHFSGNSYVPNMLDATFNTTAYLTKGKIERTQVDLTYTATAKKATPMFDENGAFVGLDVQSMEYKVPVNMVYFDMKELEVYEPVSGKMYNYAFPNTDGSKKARSKKGGEDLTLPHFIV